MDNFNILETKENEDGSLTLTVDLSIEMRDLLIAKGLNAILKEALDQEIGELK